MALHENIKYIRDKKIAGLLNEMVLQVLSKSPEDPLEELISFLGDKIKHRVDNVESDDEAPINSLKGARPTPKPAPKPADTKPAPTPQIDKKEDPKPKPKDDDKPKPKPQRQEAVEIKTTKKDLVLAKLTTEAAQPIPSMEDDLAAMIVNESLFRATLSANTTKVKSSRKDVALQKSQKITDLCNQLYAGSDQIDHYFERHVSGMDNLSFTHYKVLDCAAQILRNETRFKGVLEGYKGDVTGKWASLLSQSLNNSKITIELISQVENCAFDIEILSNGGCIGSGTHHYAQQLSHSILKCIDKLAAGNQTFREGYTNTSNKPLAPKTDMEGICREWLTNENTFRTFLREMQLKQKGNPTAREFIARAVRNSERSDELMRSAGLNYLFLKEGRNPQSKDEVLHLVQLSKERIRHCAAQLTAQQIRTVNQVYGDHVNADCAKLSNVIADGKKKLEKEAAKAMTNATVKKAFSMTDEINKLLQTIAENDARLRAIQALN